MAATFVVEDGTGLETANSYLSEADADQYHENYGDPSSWSTASQPDKENALREATRYLDFSYINRWRGMRLTKDQALDWPRSGVVDVSGWSRDSDSVPVEVEAATAIAALAVVDGDILLPEVTSGDRDVTREKNKVGPIEEDKSYRNVKGNFKRYSRIDAALRPLTIGKNTRIRA